jgi:hypothetical protein
MDTKHLDLATDRFVRAREKVRARVLRHMSVNGGR